MIEVINRELLIPREEYNIGTCYDDNTETRHFHLKRVTSGGVDLAALTFNLDILYADGNTDAASLVKEVTDKDINLVLTINNSMLQVPGTVLIQIRALDEDGVCKWTSYKSAFFVEDHINTPGHYEGDLTQLEQYEAEWGKVRDNVNQLNSRMDEVVKIHDDTPATEVEEEVIDGRVGYNGTQYDSFGTAVRQQIINVREDMEEDTADWTEALAAEATARQAADNTLQNNINAEAAARQTADNTLQNNINSEASTRASADSNLQSQINQIIAPSGEAPSAAEVQNARIGADNAKYPTLGEAIRGQVTDLKSAFDNEKEILTNNVISLDMAGNLVEKGIFEKGFLNETTGEPQGNSVINSRTGFIDIDVATYITYFRTDTSYYLYFYCYDASKGYLGRKTDGATATDRDSLPSGTKFIRIATYKSASTGLIDPYGDLIVRKAFENQQFYTYPQYILPNGINVSHIKECESSSNLYDENTKWVGASPSSDGRIYNISEFSANWTSDYIEVGIGHKIISAEYERNNSNIQVYYWQYDANYLKTVGEVSIGKYDSFSFTPNEATKYIRIKTWNNTYTDEEHCKLYSVKIYATDNVLTDYKAKDIPKAKEVIPHKYIGRDIYDPWYIPPYYYGMLQDRIQTLMSLCRSCRLNGDSFIFITDSHWNTYNQQHSPALIKYLSKYLNIDKLFHGGDLSDGVKNWWIDTKNKHFDPTFVKYGIEQIKLLREAVDGKAFFTVGNHEYFLQSNDQDINYQLMTYLPKDVVYGNAERNYYYYDNELSKIRYIVLNAYSYNGVDYSCGQGYETSQLTWLQNTALDVSDGWTIVVMSHCFYHFDDNTETTYTVDNQSVIDILNNYSGNGEIACLIQGHTHMDRIIETAENGLKCVMVTCDKNIAYDEETRLDYRVTGTDQEQAFDVVTLNRTNRTVTFTRIGGYAYDGVGEQWGNLVNQRVITY